LGKSGYLLGTYLIRRPLDRLLDVADRWRTGDLAARTGIPDDGSEFGRLAGAFDSMAMAQEARVSRLPSFSDDTEHLYDNRLRCHHFSELFDERH
jgi:HAMP domain-containing protein